MHKTDLVGVHETWITHHVAAVREIDRKHGPSTIPDRAGSMIVKGLVVVRLDIAARKRCLYVFQEFLIDSHQIFEVTMNRAILDHPDLSVTFDNLGFDLTNLFIQ